MANYVERDGDWVWRPPGMLEQASMYIFVLRANAGQLTQLCDRFINNPSGGAVDAAPLFPLFPFVLLVCVDIKHGYSAHPNDIGRGYMTERDMGFFVPVNFTDTGGATSVANLLPFLYVDNFPAVVIGREIYGFPKVLGHITFLEDPPYFDLTSPAIPNHGQDRIVVERPIVVVRRSAVGLPPQVFAGPIATVTGQIVQLALTALGVPPGSGAGFTDVPMVFLKQFRDVANPAVACHQSVVRAESSLDTIRALRVHTDTFEINVRKLDSIDIARVLGLVPMAGQSTLFKPVITVSADLDFSLPAGTTEWTAP